LGVVDPVDDDDDNEQSSAAPRRAVQRTAALARKSKSSNNDSGLPANELARASDRCAISNKMQNLPRSPMTPCAQARYADEDFTPRERKLSITRA